MGGEGAERQACESCVYACVCVCTKVFISTMPVLTGTNRSSVLSLKSHVSMSISWPEHTAPALSTLCYMLKKDEFCPKSIGNHDGSFVSGQCF